MLRLSLEALQIIDTVDRLGSFAAASKEIHRVPSTISYTVSKLEQDLGVEIFERAGSRLTLTPAGDELLKEGRHLLKAAEDLATRVRRVATGWETKFVIGMDTLFAPIALAEDVKAFYQAADRTQLRFVQETLSGTWEALLERRADLLIGASGQGPSGGGYIVEPMGTLRFVFAVAPSHPLAGVSRPIGKSDLYEHRTVAVADSARTLPVRTIGLIFGQETITVPDIQCKLDFQLAGIGGGFLPEPCVRQAIAAGRLIEKQVEEPKPDETYYLAWRTNEQGNALKWWLERMRREKALEHLLQYVSGARQDTI